MPGFDRVAIEIDMRIEVLAVAVFVRAAAELIRVVKQVGDACDPVELIEEFARLD